MKELAHGKLLISSFGKKKERSRIIFEIFDGKYPQWTAHSPSTMPNIPDYSLVSPRDTFGGWGYSDHFLIELIRPMADGGDGEF